MKFNKLFTSVICAFVSVFTTVAQGLPAAHTKAADEYITKNLSSTSFMEQAFSLARVSTPFAETEKEAVSYDMAMANNLVDYASRFLGTRYVWGATGPSSFDCSGFTSYIYRNIGVSLMRTSREQFTQGERVRSVRDMRPGDLMFFSSRRSGSHGVGHVGMVVSVDPENGTCRFIHASTRHGVTYQNFPDDGYYSAHYMGARRILGADQMASND